jgi:hypothetical protein
VQERGPGTERRGVESPARAPHLLEDANTAPQLLRVDHAERVELGPSERPRMKASRHRRERLCSRRERRLHVLAPERPEEFQRHSGLSCRDRPRLELDGGALSRDSPGGFPLTGSSTIYEADLDIPSPPFSLACCCRRAAERRFLRRRFDRHRLGVAAMANPCRARGSALEGLPETHAVGVARLGPLSGKQTEGRARPQSLCAGRSPRWASALLIALAARAASGVRKPRIRPETDEHLDALAARAAWRVLSRMVQCGPKTRP